MSQMLLVLTVLAALAAPAIATPMFARPASQTVSEALAGPALERELDRQRSAGFAALYSLEYAEAQKAFDEFVRLAPERPQGYLFRATTVWLKSLFDQRLLSTSLYSRDDYYAQKEKNVDPVVDKLFRSDVKRAIDLADARVKANPKDTESLYYLGAAHGALGGYEATMARAFFAALRNGSKAVDLHEKVLKLDPTFADAYLTIGLYHYVVGSLPFAVKIAAAMGGVRGSKRTGLSEIERAAKSGVRVGDDARVMLVGLYAREGRLEDSIAVLRELKSKYPSNYIVALEEANTLVKLKRFDDSYAAFATVSENPRASLEARDFLEYSHGEALRLGGRYDRALSRLALVWTWKGADADLVTLARLSAGQCHDALKQRQDALAQYRMVIRRADVLDSRKRAEQLTKTPYSPSLPMASTGQL